MDEMFSIKIYLLDLATNFKLLYFQDVMEFPESLTNVHRAYVHKYVQKMGLKSKSYGDGKFYLTKIPATFILIFNLFCRKR